MMLVFVYSASLVKQNLLVRLKKFMTILPSMRLVKIVREFAGLNPWQMHKAMGKKTVQAYLSLERNAKRITLSDFFQLEKIYMDAGGSKEQFDELARKSAKKD